jgi:hypothetical protein
MATCNYVYRDGITCGVRAISGEPRCNRHFESPVETCTYIDSGGKRCSCRPRGGATRCGNHRRRVANHTLCRGGCGHYTYSPRSLCGSCYNRMAYGFRKERKERQRQEDLEARNRKAQEEMNSYIDDLVAAFDDAII